MEDIKKLELKLMEILNVDKKNWTHFYVLLKKIEQERLWEDSFNSFTAWVKNFAIQANTHESIIWNRKKAGEVYQNYVKVQKTKGIEAPPLEQVSISDSTLVLLDKIAKQAPDLGAELTEKALNKEIKKKDLQEAYNAIRNKTAPARPSKNRDKDSISKDNADEAAIAEASAKIEKEKIIKEAITSTEIITTLYGTEWLNDKITLKRNYFKTSFEQDKYKVFTEFPVFTGTTKKSRRIDALVLENISSNNTWELNIHAVEVKVSKHDLLQDTKYTEYGDFTDFLWLAIPQELLEVAKETKPTCCGIIVISNKKATIVEQATKLAGNRKVETLSTLALKLI